MAVRFGTGNSRVTFANINPLPIANQISVMGWLDPEVSNNYPIITQGTSTTAVDFGLFQNSANNYFSGKLNINGTVRTITATGSAYVPGTRTKQHVCMTYDGASLKLYISGVLSTTVAYTGNIVLSTSPLTFSAPGTGNAGSGDYIGSIDDVRVYGRALNFDEVNMIVSALGRDGLYDGLLAWYQLNEGAPGVALVSNQTGQLKDYSPFNRAGQLTNGSCTFDQTFLNSFTNAYIKNASPLSGT